MISLNHHMHFWLDNAKMALKPLSQTENEVTVQFHWLKGARFKPKDDFLDDEDTDDAAVGLGIWTENEEGQLERRLEDWEEGEGDIHDNNTKLQR